MKTRTVSSHVNISVEIVLYLNVSLHASERGKIIACFDFCFNSSSNSKNNFSWVKNSTIELGDLSKVVVKLHARYF